MENLSLENSRFATKNIVTTYVYFGHLTVKKNMIHTIVT